uniref:C-type lectin domain-containing protein n=1 Tax=Clytia hemisphaerica TaxID=252671 RepID=A0A7M5UY77_9CNID
MYCWILLIFTHALMYGEASTLQTYNSGIRFESNIFPGFYIGFEENEILENSNETLLYLKEDSLVSNRTLWFVEKQIECNKNDYDGFYLRSYTYPQYYMSLTIKNTLQLTRSSDSKACLIAVDKENGTVTIEFSKSTDYSFFGLNAVNHTIDFVTTSMVDDNIFFETWKPKYNAHEETKGNCDSAGGAWSIWSDWSLCSSSCGNDGIQKRYRKCFSDQCLIEFDVDTKICNRQRCPVQADYYTTLWKCYYWPPVHGQWSNWSTVNETFQNETTCPGKLSLATRQCDSPTPEYCGMYCGSSSIKIDIFPVDGGWSSWSGFSSCTLSCGSGTQYRTRACDNPARQYGGKHCQGDEREERACNTNPCPVDGGWSSWSGFSSCTLSCGSGAQYRTRACDNPASQYGGKHCEGDEREERACNTNPCPGCRSGWTQRDHECFMYIPTQRTWSDAESDCVVKGGHLVTVYNGDRKQFIIDTFLKASNTEIWIGMNDRDTEGVFKWVSGVMYVAGQNYYDDWGPDEPNNMDQTPFGYPGQDEDCVQMKTQDNFQWRWNDELCESNLSYVCEAPLA